MCWNSVKTIEFSIIQREQNCCPHKSYDNAKMPRQCKFKRKNANIKGKTLKSHDNANLKGENIVYMMSIRTFIDYVYK